jgi:hypothetical protein
MRFEVTLIEDDARDLEKFTATSQNTIRPQKQITCWTLGEGRRWACQVPGARLVSQRIA